MNRQYPVFFLHVALSILAIGFPLFLHAQAAPGPIRGVTPEPAAQNPTRAGTSTIPAAPRVQPRKTLVGAWRLNRDESSDPRGRGANGGNGPYGGGGNNGPYGGGGGNGPYGRPRTGGIGFPFPGGGGNGPYGGGNGPYGGGRNGGGYPNSNQSPQQAMRPASSLTIEQKDSEIDLVDERQDRTELFTDGRKLQKQKNSDPVRQVAAHWEDRQLVTDERTPQGDRMTRTFELSPDGLQLIETIAVDTRRSNAPMTLRYVYDAAP